MKAGKSSAEHGLCPGARQLAERGEGFLLGRDAADQLHQLHHRHRVHEVHAHERPGPVGAAARRVIEIDEVLVAISASARQVRHQVFEDLALDRFVLGRGLDDQIASRETGVVGPVVMRPIAACHRPRDQPRRTWRSDCARSGMRAVSASSDESAEDIKPAQRTDMGNAVAHLARADNADRLIIVLTFARRGAARA